MRPTTTWMITGLALTLATSACSKGGDKPVEKQPPTTPGKGSAATTPADASGKTAAVDTPDGVAEQVGVEPGGVTREDDEGPAAVVTAKTGTVEVRRLGEEEFAALPDDGNLYAGDQVRTGNESTATVGVADETVVELAEESAIAIGEPGASADPASSIAVLSGIARFTVAKRGEGEGPFLAFVPGGAIATKGTTYAIGVAADGEARVGVESGLVEVVGAGVLEAPVDVKAGSAATIAVAGTVAPPSAFATDDWGDWRDGADADLDFGAAVTAHGQAMAGLEADLGAGYSDLDRLGDSTASFEASAEASADGDDTAGYETAEVDGAAAIEASYLTATRVQMLTWSLAAHAYLASELYVRHPDVEVQFQATAPRIHAAVLYPKKLNLVAHTYLVPLRGLYYVHHPVGRVHAATVGVEVPEFYGRVTLKPLPAGRARKMCKTAVYTPPQIRDHRKGKRVWVAAPAVGWNAKVKVRPAPPRAKVAWYVRPPAPRSKALIGVAGTGKIKVMFPTRPPQPRAKIKVKVGVAGKLKGTPGKIKIVIPRPHTEVKVKAGVTAGAAVEAGGVRVKEQMPTRPAPPSVKGGAGAGAGAKVKVKVGAGADAKAGAGVKVKIPKPKIKVPKPPKVEVKGGIKIKGGVKIGH